MRRIVLQELSGRDPLTDEVILRPQGEPDSFVEVGALLDAGETVTYTWSASETVKFNIHTHSNQRVEYHEEVSAPQREGAFQAPRSDHFYLMWQNPGTAPTKLRLRVDRGR